MNKQQLAAKIWESANNLRGKMEAGEYKDYILGFIFYKFLSDKEYKFLIQNGYEQSDIEELREENEEEVDWIKRNIGFFIEPKNLFSNWIEIGNDFSVDNVVTALSAFSRNIYHSHKNVFSDIFKTLEQGISKLGETSVSRTKAIKNLIEIINDVPTSNQRDYDVLGFIYEYLIGQFASSAGKKAGEFYTPHEVSVIMAELVAAHLKDKETINIYDPTSGSGSLLINIGQSVGKHIEDTNKIKYYAQELIESTYNLTRMNLIMRGILPDNIVTRNGDTLEEDWPWFDDNDKVSTYNPLFVDAVVSNPPYSQKWDPANKDIDPRYAEYGLAPKSKADYAFLLHDLYHLKPDGIMTIVLPHGVLFRGGEEGTIRKNLIEKNKIDAIIGLPANIFFGTGIPTIILVLKKHRDNTDVLFVDASKGFKKAGNKNVLQASDIKRIVDAVIQRKKVEKFSHIATLQDIKDNEYNLNIPRYVESNEEAEKWDIYATMYGGIPKNELEDYKDIWEAFPRLYDELFDEINRDYVKLKSGNTSSLLKSNDDIINFKGEYESAFRNFDSYLYNQLIENVAEVKLANKEEILTMDIFSRLNSIKLIDRYDAFQILNDSWKDISGDIEILQKESFDSVRIVDPNMITKKVNGKDTIVQDGWLGRIIPFDLVQSTILKAKEVQMSNLVNRLSEVQESLDEIISTLSEAEGEFDVLNDSNDKFVLKDVNSELSEFYKDIETSELITMREYLVLLDSKGSKKEKIEFVSNHPEVNWSAIPINGSGTYNKKDVMKYVSSIQKSYKFQEGSFASKLSSVVMLLEEEKDLKKEIKENKAELHELTKITIENLSDEQANELLKLKWIDPLTRSIRKLPDILIKEIAKKVLLLQQKYDKTFIEVSDEIENSTKKLGNLLDELTGSEFDMKGIRRFKKLLIGDKYDK
ncbi:type I restriction-modification system subunit M [Oceanobacillus zhaokaii]|uniref:site-specific DNA-methyltransferase (adenine-specific) n=1 Tax=Oceanobacillus zhaokaii TaxID=2052660 RepID=A0A345PEK8_9BACI|nr:type I restriction-modification system subunit M [Oceanobacillus zhaokaii]AXI08438.1 type I restriction-modification system subunit M [Oceanobacillus zhaokaii]